MKLPHSLKAITYRTTWVRPLNDEFARNQMTLVDGWLMVANEDNSDYPAPIPLGASAFILPDNPVWNTLSNSSTVDSGNQYDFIEAGWIEQIRVWVTAVSPDITYRIVMADITNPNNIRTQFIDNPTLTPNQWTVVTLGNRITTVGTKLVIYIEALNSGSDTVFSDGWTFSGNSQGASPASTFWNTSNQSNPVRFHWQSLGGNYQAQLQGLVPNSTIEIVQNGTPTNYLTFRTTAPTTDNGAGGSNIAVTLDDSGGTIATNAECTVTFTSPVPQPTEYVELAGTTSPSFANVIGRLQFDGVDQPGANGNTYGIDIKFQRGELSPFWDVMAYSAELSNASQEVSVVDVLAAATPKLKATSNLLYNLGTTNQLLSFPNLIENSFISLDITSTEITFSKSGSYVSILDINFVTNDNNGTWIWFVTQKWDGISWVTLSSKAKSLFVARRSKGFKSLTESFDVIAGDKIRTQVYLEQNKNIDIAQDSDNGPLGVITTTSLDLTILAVTFTN